MNNTMISKQFQNEINKAYKPVDKETELELIKLAQKGDIDARNALVDGQIRKVLQVARGYVGKHNDISELMSIGINGYQGKNGLIQAIQDFKLDCNNRLITVGIFYILNAIRNYSADNTLIHIPRSKSKSQPNDPDLIEEHTFYAECRNMTLDEYMKYMDSIGEPISLRKPALIINPSSLDTPLINDNSTTVGDLLADDSAIDANMHIAKSNEINNLNSIMNSTLTNDERDLIKAYYYNEYSMQEIGDMYNKSKQTISKRIENIMNKLRVTYDNEQST